MAVKESSVFRPESFSTEVTELDELSENLSLRAEYISDARVFTRTPDQVHPDPSQPRQEFDEDKLKEMAKSMDETGQSSPIKVYFSEKNQRLEVLFGESRYRAKRDFCQNKNIDCILVEEPSDEMKYDIRVDENLHRKEFTIDELLTITVNYHERFTAENATNVNQKVAERLQISPTEVTRRLTVHRARNHHDPIIEDAFAKAIASKHLDNMSVLYYLGNALMSEGAERRKHPARDLVMKALQEGAGSVTKKQAEEASKQASGKSKLSYKWKPKYLVLEEEKPSTVVEDEKPSTTEGKREQMSSPEPEEGAPEVSDTGDAGQTTDGRGGNGKNAPQERKLPGRRLKSLSVEVGEDPEYMRIKANSGFITKDQALEFAEQLRKAAENM